MGPLEQTALRGGELLTGFLERFHEVTIRISAAQVPGRALGPLACLLNVHQGDVDLFEVALVHAESPKAGRKATGAAGRYRLAGHSRVTAVTAVARPRDRHVLCRCAEG